MIGQQNNRIQREWVVVADLVDRFVQGLTCDVAGQERSTAMRDNREKISSTGNTCAAIVGHGDVVGRSVRCDD